MDQVTQSDSVEEQENSEDTIARLGSRIGQLSDSLHMDGSGMSFDFKGPQM